LESLAPWQLRSVMDLMQARLSERVYLDDLAKACGLSASYFSRLFKRSTGVSPHQSLLVQRIEHAKHLLECTGMPIVEVASVCVFADQAHVTRAFSRGKRRPPRLSNLDATSLPDWMSALVHEWTSCCDCLVRLISQQLGPL